MERQVGAPADLSRLAPGAHVCCVVDPASPFEDWARACLEDGARQGQKLFRFAPREVLAGLSSDGAVTLADPHTAFLDGGPLVPETMYAMFRERTEAARREGYRGLRLVADMDWLRASEPDSAAVAAFEVLLDEVVRELGATVVCAYRTGRFDAEAVAEVVAVHPITVGDVPVDPGFRMWNAGPGVWEVAGEVDAENAETFHRLLAEVAESAASLRLCTAGLEFVALAGAHALARVGAARPDLPIVVDDACPSLRQCWELGGFGRHAPRVVVRPPGEVTRPPVGASGSSVEKERDQ